VLDATGNCITVDASKAIPNCVVHRADASSAVTCRNCGFGFTTSADLKTCVVANPLLKGAWLSQIGGGYFPLS
jgi:hypothetical protein